MGLTISSRPTYNMQWHYLTGRVPRSPRTAVRLQAAQAKAPLLDC